MPDGIGKHIVYLLKSYNVTAQESTRQLIKVGYTTNAKSRKSRFISHKQSPAFFEIMCEVTFLSAVEAQRFEAYLHGLYLVHRVNNLSDEFFFLNQSEIDLLIEKMETKEHPQMELF